MGLYVTLRNPQRPPLQLQLVYCIISAHQQITHKSSRGARQIIKSYAAFRDSGRPLPHWPSTTSGGESGALGRTVQYGGFYFTPVDVAVLSFHAVSEPHEENGSTLAQLFTSAAVFDCFLWEALLSRVCGGDRVAVMVSATCMLCTVH